MSRGAVLAYYSKPGAQEPGKGQFYPEDRSETFRSTNAASRTTRLDLPTILADAPAIARNFAPVMLTKAAEFAYKTARLLGY